MKNQVAILKKLGGGFIAYNLTLKETASNYRKDGVLATAEELWGEFDATEISSAPENSQNWKGEFHRYMEANPATPESDALAKLEIEKLLL